MKTKRDGTEERRGMRSRLGVSLAFVGAAAACWLVPAHATQRIQSTAGANAPATAPAAGTAAGPDSTSAAPAGNEPGANGPTSAVPDSGERNRGLAEPGPGGLAGPE